MTVAQRTIDNGTGTDYVAHVDSVAIGGNTADVQPMWLGPRAEYTHYDLVTQASAVAALDQLCDEVELTSMSLVPGGSGMLNNMLLQCNNLTVISAEMWLYQVNPTAAGTNAVHDQSDANAESSRQIGAVQFISWYASTSNMWSYGTYAGFPLSAAFGLPYVCADGTNTTSIWGILMTRTATTPGATTDYNLGVWHTPGI